MIPYNSNYSIITDRVAIGNILSPYEPFQIVINLAYPDNQVKHRQIHFEQNNQILCRIGIYDSPDEPIIDVLDYLIEKLVRYTQRNPTHHILFHCHAGISRSSTVAIAYLCKLLNRSYEEVFAFVKSKRPIIDPNIGFRNALQKFTR